MAKAWHLVLPRLHLGFLLCPGLPCVTEGFFRLPDLLFLFFHLTLPLALLRLPGPAKAPVALTELP